MSIYVSASEESGTWGSRDLTENRKPLLPHPHKCGWRWGEFIIRTHSCGEPSPTHSHSHTQVLPTGLWPHLSLVTQLH